MAAIWLRKAPLLAALCLWVATIGLPAPALAFTPPQPAWNQLSSPQQEALKPLAGEWDKLDNFRKKKWLGVAEKFSSMAPDAQKRLHARMGDWARMTPEQRRAARDNFQQAKTLPPEQKKAEWQKYQTLPESQKKRIAAAAESTKPVKRKQERRAQTANAKTAKPTAKAAQGAPAPTVPPATAPVASAPVPPEAPAASPASPTATTQAPATIAAPAAVGVPPAPAAALTAPATSN